MTTIKEAYDNWAEGTRPGVIKQYGEDDQPALAESWNDYTDMLCKDGELSDLQYHYCPAYDDSIPDDDHEHILESMNVEMVATQVSVRADGLDSEWSRDASHWNVTLTRDDNARLTTPYSMGSAHRSSPDMADVFHSLLMDSDAIESEEFEEDEFVEWCGNIDASPDSRIAERQYRACIETARELREMFSDSELDQLRELFEDY